MYSNLHHIQEFRSAIPFRGIFDRANTKKPEEGTKTPDPIPQERS